jgi:hypothetical protein
MDGRGDGLVGREKKEEAFWKKTEKDQTIHQGRKGNANPECCRLVLNEWVSAKD